MISAANDGRNQNLNSRRVFCLLCSKTVNSWLNCCALSSFGLCNLQMITFRFMHLYNFFLRYCIQSMKSIFSLLLPYARDKTAVDLFHFSLFCLWSIREGSLFKNAVYFTNSISNWVVCLFKKSVYSRGRSYPARTVYENEWGLLGRDRRALNPDVCRFSKELIIIIKDYDYAFQRRHLEQL